VYPLPMQIRHSPSPVRLIVTAAALVLVGGLAVSATSPPRQQPESSSGMLVSIDFRALTNDGVPVLDLKAEDIVLKVNGRARALKALHLLDSGDGRTITAGTPAPTLSPPFATNGFSESGRGMLLVVDDASIAPGREHAVKEAIMRLIDGLAARDRVGLLLLPHGAAVNLTVDHAAVRKQATGIVGRLVSDEAATDSACRTRVNIEALKEIFADFSSGSPTTLVFFTNGMSPPATDGVSRMKQPTVGACEIRMQDYDELAKAFSASRVDVHVVQILDEVTSGVATTSELTAGLENLAGVTGNRMIRLTGNESVVARVARETSAYYVVGFDADPSERNGASQRLEVSTSRQNVRISVRQRVTFPRVDGRPLDGSAPPNARDMLATARVYRDLPLIAASFFSRHNTADKVKTVVMFDTSDPNAALASATVGLFDRKGKLTAQWTAQVTDLSRAPVLAALTAPPGTYRMRVAATDGAGRGGTVDEEVKLELAPAGPVKLSGLVLGVSVGSGFSPTLMFEAESAAIAYLEIYGAPRTAPLSVTIELAESETASPLVSGAANMPAAAEDGFRAAYGTVPIGNLPPGNYLVRATVQYDGKTVGQAVRTLHKAGK
jgi:hypothetical protein